MSHASFISSDDIRTLFSQAMSKMYQNEVPQYGKLIDLVKAVNHETLKVDVALHKQLAYSHQLSRLGLERHGAIRVGTASELANLRRLFAVMGMEAVGYYDLTVASVPVHSTAFRPITAQALAINPFRVFTSLLRLELIENIALREQAQTILDNRNIFTPRCLALINQFEQAGGLTQAQAAEFIHEALYTFKWHQEATVNAQAYHNFRQAHPLVADVVCFKGPHINHLTPRTLDIDAVQHQMPVWGIKPKQTIEGPPRRQCPILLRQTSFMALSESIVFNESGSTAGQHTARFGEVEQRGLALTKDGRKLYDDLLGQVRLQMQGVDQSDYSRVYPDVLSEVFKQFPDDWKTLQEQALGYFYAYANLDLLRQKPIEGSPPWHKLVADGYVLFEPMIYEDFLPVSAAGIFQSNLGNENQDKAYQARSNQDSFQEALGVKVHDEFVLYANLQQVSILNTQRALGVMRAE